MNPWVKKDVNVLVICKRSRDNRQDVLRWQATDGTEGFFLVFQQREAGTGENRWLAHQKERERSDF